MSENISNIDFSEFIKKNREKIIKNTPYNPSISKNDEWREETEWDERYKELQEG